MKKITLLIYLGIQFMMFSLNAQSPAATYDKLIDLDIDDVLFYRLTNIDQKTQPVPVLTRKQQFRVINKTVFSDSIIYKLKSEISLIKHSEVASNKHLGRKSPDTKLPIEDCFVDSITLFSFIDTTYNKVWINIGSDNASHTTHTDPNERFLTGVGFECGEFFLFEEKGEIVKMVVKLDQSDSRNLLVTDIVLDRVYTKKIMPNGKGVKMIKIIDLNGNGLTESITKEMDDVQFASFPEQYFYIDIGIKRVDK